MTLEEVKKFIDENKDDKEVQNYIRGFITADRVENFLNGEDGKKVLQPRMDKYFTKGLDTWKENNLPKLVDEKIKELYPEEDPKDLELKKLRQEMEEMKREAELEKLRNQALKIATEKNLPTDMVDFFIGENEETTLNNLEIFEKTFTENLESKVKERLKDNSYTPPSGESTASKNPYLKETWSLTEQAELESKDPDKAKQLREIAEKGEDNSW